MAILGSLHYFQTRMTIHHNGSAEHALLVATRIGLSMRAPIILDLYGKFPATQCQPGISLFLKETDDILQSTA